MHTHQMIVFQKKLETVEALLLANILIPISQDSRKKQTNVPKFNDRLHSVRLPKKLPKLRSYLD